MIIKPKFRGFICTTAHPEGLKKNVEEQIKYIENKKNIDGGPKNALIIGSSGGYGFSSRVALTVGACANTVGVHFDKAPKGKRTGTPGWYNDYYLSKYAEKKNIFYKSFNQDAFSNETKDSVIETIKNNLGTIDLLIYSVASPRRKDPNSGKIYTSSLKPIGGNYRNKTVDFHTGEVSEIELEKANDDEIFQTIKVMGGEDWNIWLDKLDEASVLSDGFKTVAFSYIGPEITHPIYKDGAIGKAKEDLLKTSRKLNEKLSVINGNAYISVNKALVTQASSAIPVVPLYISILYKVMKEKKIHEGCIEQMYRLIKNNLFGKLNLDSEKRIRIDNYEMREDVQEEVKEIWNKINSDNINQVSDINGYREEFFNLFGFARNDVDYEKDCDINPK